MGTLPVMWLARSRDRDEVLRQMVVNVAPPLMEAQRLAAERERLAHEAVAAMEAG